jgi:hypothetical protein
VIRGSKAWDMVKAADASNKPVDAGYEYLMARVEFSFGPGGIMIYKLRPDLFTAFSLEKKGYIIPAIVSPKPEFIGKAVYPGNTTEGWIPFIVSQKDSNPVMLYTGSNSRDESNPDISCTAPDYWFQLY